MKPFVSCYVQAVLPHIYIIYEQDLLSNKEQILMVSNVMEKIGLLMPYKKMSMFSDVLCLYDYPQLSPVDQLSLMLMGKMSDLKPVKHQFTLQVIKNIRR